MRQFFSLLVLPLLSWWWFCPRITTVNGGQHSAAIRDRITPWTRQLSNPLGTYLLPCRIASIDGPVQTLHPASVIIGSTCENGNLLIFPPGNILWGDYGASTKFLKNLLTFVRRHHRLTLLLCFFPRDATPSPSIITTRITALEHASQGPCGR